MCTRPDTKQFIDKTLTYIRNAGKIDLHGVEVSVEPFQQLSGLASRNEGGAYLEERPLPSVKQLQQEYGVGRDTVLRAIDILREEAPVFTVARRGTYVSPEAK